LLRAMRISRPTNSRRNLSGSILRPPCSARTEQQNLFTSGEAPQSAEQSCATACRFDRLPLLARRPPEMELRDRRMPARVLDLPDPPDALYVRGELPRGPSVAIVGTRRPTPEARKFARRLARELASAGVSVLSGGAKGIDAAAHEGALRAHGTTV